MTGPSDDRRIVVVTAGLGQPSSSRLLGDRLAAAAVEALGERGVAAGVQVVELREHAQALAHHLLTGFPAEELQAAVDAVLAADGLVVVSPVFNASYSGLFKTFFDVVEQGALEGVPTVLAATGGSARHSLVLEHALRPLFAYLRAATVPTAVYAATDDWGAAGSGGTSSSGDATLAARVRRAGHELAALVTAAGPRSHPDAFAEPTPFTTLLAGG